jgi:PhnB protein
MPGAFYVYVSDVAAVYKRALPAGAVSLMEPVDTFYGNRESGVKDQFGNSWWIATHVEDVTPEEIQKRFEAVSKE